MLECSNTTRCGFLVTPNKIRIDKERLLLDIESNKDNLEEFIKGLDINSYIVK